jgi:hypothetical protein
MNNKPQPVETFKCGNFDFAMWNNQGEDSRTFQSISIKRNYRDANGNWQDGGEIRLLPQQLNDIILGSQEMYRFWRLGVRQKKQQTIEPEGHAQSTSSESSAEQQRSEAAQSSEPPEPPAGQKPEPSSEQGELSVDSAGQQGFRGKVSQSRGSKRSR